MKVFSELLVNLRSLRISFTHDDVSNTADQLEIIDGVLVMDKKYHLCPVDNLVCSLHAAKITTDGSTTNISIPAVSKSPISSDDQPIPYKDVSEIKKELPVQQIECSSCGAELLSKPLLSVVDLPSEHWQELLDCWICHPTEDVMSKLSKIGIKPSEGKLSCGTSYFLVHFDDIKPDSVIETQTIAKDPKDFRNFASQMLCSHCDMNLGVTFDDQHAGDLNQLSSARFNKYSVNLVFKNNVFSHPFMECFLFDLWESRQAHAHYKFLICSNETSEPELLVQLWIFQWNSVVHLKDSSNADNGFRNAIKCLYATPEVEHWSKVLNEWKNDKLIETLFYPSSQCRFICKHLKKTSEFPLQKMPSGYEVGFIFKE